MSKTKEKKQQPDMNEDISKNNGKRIRYRLRKQEEEEATSLLKEELKDIEREQQ